MKKITMLRPQFASYALLALALTASGCGSSSSSPGGTGSGVMSAPAPVVKSSINSRDEINRQLNADLNSARTTLVLHRKNITSLQVEARKQTTVIAECGAPTPRTIAEPQLTILSTELRVLTRSYNNLAQGAATQTQGSQAQISMAEHELRSNSPARQGDAQAKLAALNEQKSESFNHFESQIQALKVQLATLGQNMTSAQASLQLQHAQISQSCGVFH